MPPPRLKRSNVPAAVPSSLEDGEIAINQADGTLFFRTAAGGVGAVAATMASHTHAAEAIVSGTLADARLSPNVPLLVNNLLPAAFLPSYVDDVIEVSALPASGETGKIYVVSAGGNANKIYRWSGASFVEISPSPGSSDAVPEGSVNLYHTTLRASAAAPVQSVNSKVGAVVLSAADVGAAASSHAHGNLTSAGAIGSTANLPVITTTSGVLTVGAFGTSAGSFCQGNDSRLSDSRPPSGAAGGSLAGTFPNPALSATGVAAGTFTKLTVQADGRVTVGATATAADVGAASASHTHVASAITDFATEAAKYGPVVSVNGLTGAVTVQGVSDGNKGDITVSSSGATWTINAGAVVTADVADSAVTYAKMQNVSATDRLLGRSSAGAGVIEEIACTAAGRAILDDADAASQRTTLGLGTLSTQSAGAVALTGGTINGVSVGAGTASTGAFTTLAASGNVSIGTATAFHPLHVYAPTASVAARVETGGTYSAVQLRDSGGRCNIICSAGAITLQPNDVSRFFFLADGTAGIGAYPSAGTLDVAGSVRASGGILFGTDTAAANTLADYEEGTWTPAISAVTTAPTYTLNAASGRYTKIGRAVFVDGYIQASNFSGGSGAIRVTGLPFSVPGNTTSHRSQGQVDGGASGFVTRRPKYCEAVGGSGSVAFSCDLSDTAGVDLLPANFPSAGTAILAFSLLYYT